MSFCGRCNRWFVDWRALEQHKRDSSFHYVCEECDKDFTTWNALKEHYVQSPRHHYCQLCNTLFRSRESLESHYIDFHHYCEKHRLIFDSAEGLEQHYVQSGEHFYCQICSLHLDDLDNFISHGRLYHFFCEGCFKIFRTEKSLLSHKECDHYYCKACDRLFTTKSNLEHHLDSSLHKPRTIKCIGRGCTRMFTSISALILHAESGTCPGGITRKMVNDFAVQHDKQNVITNPNRLLTDSSGTLSTPPDKDIWATDLSWNGFGYACCLCPRVFGTLRALNMHYRSPRHAAKIYRCPMEECGLEFSVLSALVQHFERGTCGIGQSRQVKDVMDQLTSGMRRIAV